MRRTIRGLKYIDELLQLACWMRSNHNRAFYRVLNTWQEQIQVLRVRGQRLKTDVTMDHDTLATLVDLQHSTAFLEERLQSA